ncbi:HEAT repeat domain-containing protein [Anabaena azotica]|uniref:HEAT repeat domain-containing protein n=1 Tax=Anabaena azotica FACHB-119 TaxID=947527 RepID=A0ABR8D0P3_9NOST|nr:HEAT repeat domain-containing protein [Anabaena azotica]MBD2500700.1 HEAT repeat domain-containing protein [Anabaena azotica FACHB-119]
MVLDHSNDIYKYLKSIYDCDNYRYPYTFTNALNRQSIETKAFISSSDIDLLEQRIQPQRQEGQVERIEKIKLLDVLEDLKKEPVDHVLLKGRPSSGKSTALKKLLWEQAKNCIEKEEENKIPVLVELRRYETSVLDLIKDFLIQHGLKLEITEIEDFLFTGRFLLLIDGLNELPDESARRKLSNFRQKYINRTSMIFTTRDSDLGFGIQKRLEIQPLTEKQMQQFIRANLPDVGEEMLRRLDGRLRKLRETPLFLFILCYVYEYDEYDEYDRCDEDILNSLGFLFRRFSKVYEKDKRDVPISADLRFWQSDLLQHLAFVMLQRDCAKDSRLTITEGQARKVLAKFLQGKVPYPDNSARLWLNDLLKYHLIENRADEQIQFYHQLIQEYYAGEKLLELLREISDDQSEARFKHKYLNDVNWTEPLALMLSLPELEEKQALTVVKLSLDVDLMLGARLAGEVKEEFQVQTVDLIAKQRVSESFKIWLLGLTRSNHAIPFLFKALENQDDTIRGLVVKALDKIVNEAAIPALSKALQDDNYFIRMDAFNALEKIGTKAIIPALQKALKDEYFLICDQAIYVLGDIAGEAAIPDLIEVLARDSVVIRDSALCVLAQLCGKKEIPELIQELADRGFDVQSDAFCAIRNWLGICFAPRRKILHGRLTYRNPHAYDLERMQNEVSITTLHQKLSDQDSEVRKTAIYMLGQIANEEAINVLLQALDSEDWRVRFDAVHWLAEIASNSSDQIIFDKVVKCLDDPNSDVVGYASYVLEQKGIPELLPKLYEFLLTSENRTYTLITVISAIQQRCGYYNYAIATSSLAVNQNSPDTLLDVVNKIYKNMSENPKVQMNFHAPITNSSVVAGNVEGDSIGNQYNSPATDKIAEVEKLLQQLLEQIEQTKPTPTEAQIIVNQAVEKHPVLKDQHNIEQAIKRYPPLKVRLQRVVTAVGIETVKVIFAPAGIVIEGIRALIEPE